MASSLTAQWESWNGLAAEYEFSNTWAAEAEIEYRFLPGENEPGEWLITLAANRLLVGRLDITPGLRYNFAYADNPAELRTFADLNYDFPIDADESWEVTFRLRYQQDRPLGEDGSERKVAARPRLGLNYSFAEHYTLAAQLEGRYRFDSFDGWSRVRYTGGLQYVPADQWEVDVFVRWEDFFVTERATALIIGVYVSYRIGSKKQGETPPRRPFGRQLLW